MRSIIAFISFLFLSSYTYSQGYTFGISYNSNYNFTIIAIPDFNSNGITDVSDIGFTLVLPAGPVDTTNPIGLISGRLWNIQQYDAAFLSGQGIGDGSKDIFQFNLPVGQSLIAHNIKDHIELVSFDITDMPVSGEMYLLQNSDPIAIKAGGILNSFYNSDIDGRGMGTPTLDYFQGLAQGIDKFSFETLGIEDANINRFIKIHPNPATDFIKIDTSLTIDEITLFDIMGRLVLRFNSDERLLNIEHLSSGNYIMSLEIENKRYSWKVTKN